MEIKVKIGDFKIHSEERKAILKVLDSQYISEGPRVWEFENAWAKYIGTQYAIATSSGTGALITALSAIKELYKIKNGKRKVITTPITYASTINSLVLTGYKPVFIDVDKNTFCITPENIEKCLKNENPKEFRMILPVHLAGYPCKMDEILRIAKKYKLFVFEDSAQAHGTKYKGKKTGSFGIASDFSFYMAHNIQAGEFGAITTNSLKLAKLCKQFKGNGRVCDCFVCTRNKGFCPHAPKDKNDADPRFTHKYIAYNFKAMEFQAAFAITQLKKADFIFSRRQKNVKYLNKKLKKYEDIFILPHFDKNVSYMCYTLVIRNPKKTPRILVRQLLEKEGVETRPLYGCMPTQQPAFKQYKRKYEKKLPNAEYLGKNAFYIGCHQYLVKKDLDFIINAFSRTVSSLLK